MKPNFYLPIIVFLLLTKYAFNQVISSNKIIQDSLSKLSAQIWLQKSDSNKLKSNAAFFSAFQSVLKSTSANEYPLDSIQGITRVSSADSKIRLFTWNVPLQNGTNKYFGFLQISQDSTMLFPLISNDKSIKNLETSQLSVHMWYGAIYYKIIDVKVGEQTAYTLLGWDGYTQKSNRKMIDILTMDKSRNIAFGMPVFKTVNGIKYRIIKEYAEKSNMLLRYDYQSIITKKKNRLSKERAWIIVMDRLVPMDPALKGMPEFNVVSGDSYDGYVFKNGYWVLVEDVEVASH